MKKISWYILILLAILVAVVAYLVFTKQVPGTTNANVVQENDISNACTSDSEPQCLDHNIGDSCNNVRDGGIPGKCIERYQACVCR